MLVRNILKGVAAAATAVVLPVAEVLANPTTGQPVDWQLGFQRAVTPVMEAIDSLHFYVLILITVISLFVLALLLLEIFRFNQKRYQEPSDVTHNAVLEVLWTAVPIVILVVMAVPSFKLLYFQDTTPEQVDLNIKATAYQWFWTYEYPDEEFEFDAFKLEPEEAEEKGEPYLLATDTRVVVPVGKVVRVQVTAADVIHAWAVPALGVKMDAYPGRLNELWFRVDEPGVYYGQCSELCGQGHAFMPIAVEAMTEANYEAWLGEAREEYARAGEKVRVADSGLSVAK
jgi:cytochrome c oxidase subunit 2